MPYIDPMGIQISKNKHESNVITATYFATIKSLFC